MKLKSLSAVFSLILFCSCKEQKEPSAPLEQNIDNELKSSQSGKVSESIECFSYTSPGDTIFISIRNRKGPYLEGDLVYSLNEKDRNRGAIYGEWKGDSLFADYEFTSEGKTSIREVFFLKTDSGMIEGFAPVIQLSNKMAFSNHNFSLNNQMLLKRTDCR